MLFIFLVISIIIAPLCACIMLFLCSLRNMFSWNMFCVKVFYVFLEHVLLEHVFCTCLMFSWNMFSVTCSLYYVLLMFSIMLSSCLCSQQEWRDALIVPLFKKGIRSEAGNYRPVSLTSVVCKVMERIIKDNIVEHLNEHDIIKGSQHGFTRGRSVFNKSVRVL